MHGAAPAALLYFALIWIGSEKMGVSARGNTIHVGIAAWPWGAYLGEEGLKRGIRVKTSSFTRHHVNVSMVRAKASGYYINSILANQEVTAEGYDEALLLDTDGYVSEGAGENVFIVKNGKIYNNTNGNDCWDATMTPSNDDVTIPDNTCDTIDYNGAAQTTFPGTDSTGGAGWLDVNLTPTDPAGDTMSWNQMVYNWYVGGSG